MERRRRPLGAEDVQAMINPDHAGPIIDSIDHPVGASPGRMMAIQRPLERLADDIRTIQQRTSDELDYRRRDSRR